MPQKKPFDDNFYKILTGRTDCVKKEFFKANPNASEDDFEKYCKKLFEESVKPFSVLENGEDIDFDEVKYKEKGIKFFYKNNVLKREVVVGDYVQDFLGTDEKSQSSIAVKRFYSDDDFLGYITEFTENKHGIQYKSVTNMLSDDKTKCITEVEINKNALNLIDKIEKTNPKYTESSVLRKPHGGIRPPKYLYHITTAENAEEIKRTGKLSFRDDEGKLSGIYCIDAENFKKQWGKHEARNNKDLKNSLFINQVENKKVSNNLVVIKIPTSKINCNKLKAGTEEDFFYSLDICYRGSLFGAKAPDCVSKGYDWATAKENFSDNKSLEYIITEPVDFKNVEIIYSGSVENGNIDDISEVIYKEAEKNKAEEDVVESKTPDKLQSVLTAFKNLFSK